MKNVKSTKKKKKKFKRMSIYARNHPICSEFSGEFDDPVDDAAIRHTLKVNPQTYARHMASDMDARGPATTFTPTVEHIILKAVKAGLGFSRSANLAGIRTETFGLWRRKGFLALEKDDLDDPYAQFLIKLRKASAHSELVHAQVLNEVGQGGIKVIEVVKTVRIDKKTKKRILVKEVRNIKKTLPNHTASLRFLERRFPQDWLPESHKSSEQSVADPIELAKRIKYELRRLVRSIPEEESKREIRLKKEKQDASDGK